MNRLLKFFWIVSIIMFFGALLLVYAFLDDRVGVLSNKLGMPDEFIARETFFYVSLITFLISNALLYILYKLMMLTRRSSKTERALALRQAIAYWLLGLAGTINLFFMMSIAFFGLFNSREKFDLNDYAILVYGGPLLLALIFGLLVHIFNKHRSQT